MNQATLSAILAILWPCARAGFEHGMVARAWVRGCPRSPSLSTWAWSSQRRPASPSPAIRTPSARRTRRATPRAPAPGSRSGFAELAPDLVAEVVSPWDRTSEVNEKALMWVDAVVRLVWIVDPKTRAVTVYRPGNVVSLLRGSSELDGEDVLPGFRFPLAELFA